MKINDNTYLEVYSYLNNDLSGDELLLFEKKLSNDNELQETVSVLKKMEIIYSPEDWLIFDGDKSKLKEAVSKFRNEDVRAFSKKIRDSEAQYKQKPKYSIKRIVLYASSIAAIGIFMLSGYFFNNKESSQDLYEHYYKVDDLPSFISKNDRLNTLTEAEVLFKEKKYSKALTLFKSIKNDEISIVQPKLLIYLALTEAEHNNYNVAINYLTELEKSDAIDNHKAYWFKTMLYLKQDDKEKAIFFLKLTTQNEYYFNYEKAISLLKTLE